MEPYHADARVTVYAGDCLDVLRQLDDASVDAVCTDPPYGLEFMGKEWDGANGFRRSLNAADAGRDNVFGRTSRTSPEYRALHTFQQWCELWATECLRALKPGGHMLSFGGTRTWHRLACAVEDAGFEVRDGIAWLYGSGFPKSHDVSKAIDKAAGAEREVSGTAHGARNGNGQNVDYGTWGSAELGVYEQRDFPATDDARTWQGWGTALKPAFEPIVVARKPLAGTVATNVLEHGTGALNIDACRIAHANAEDLAASLAKNPGRDDTFTSDTYGAGRPQQSVNAAGRWPANVVLDESQAAALDAMTGEQRDGVAGARTGKVNGYDGGWGAQPEHSATYGSGGGASRFFYTAKAPGTERVKLNGTAHPTVKPLDLMHWLVRLVTPPNGVVLDPFAGSGTTVEACILEGFRCVAIEREPDYLPLIMQRVNRRIDPVAAVKATDDDGGLFDLLGEGIA